MYVEFFVFFIETRQFVCYSFFGNIIVIINEKKRYLCMYLYFCFCISLLDHIIMTEKSLELFKCCLSLHMMDFFPFPKKATHHFKHPALTNYLGLYRMHCIICLCLVMHVVMCSLNCLFNKKEEKATEDLFVVQCP